MVKMQRPLGRNQSENVRRRHTVSSGKGSDSGLTQSPEGDAGHTSARQLLFFVFSFYRALRNHTQEPHPHFVLAQLLQRNTVNQVANQQQKCISHSSRGSKYKIMVPVSGSGESPPLGGRQLTSHHIRMRQNKSELALWPPLIL